MTYYAKNLWYRGAVEQAQQQLVKKQQEIEHLAGEYSTAAEIWLERRERLLQDNREISTGYENALQIQQACAVQKLQTTSIFSANNLDKIPLNR